MEARLLWEQEVAGSTPASPTNIFEIANVVVSPVQQHLAAVYYDHLASDHLSIG